MVKITKQNTEKRDCRANASSTDSNRVEKKPGSSFPEKFYVTVYLDASLYLEKPMKEVGEVFDLEIKAVRAGALAQIRKLRAVYLKEAEKERMDRVELQLVRESPHNCEIFWGTIDPEGIIMIYTDMGDDYLFPVRKDLEVEFNPPHGEETDVSFHEFGLKL